MARAFMANEAQFLLEIDGLDVPVFVLSFRGEEGISQPFLFSLELQSDQLDIDPADVIGQSASFTIIAQTYERTITGVVSRFESCGVEGDLGIYKAHLSPEFFKLSQVHQSRIFQNKTVVEILSEVLDEANLSGPSYKMECQASYEPLEYCVQYRESDLNFFNRMTERFGIFYFFDFSEEDTALLIGDSPDVNPPITEPADVTFQGPGGLEVNDDFVFELRLAQSLRTGLHTVRDYNFKSPNLDLTKDSTSDSDTGLEYYDYPGQFKSQSTASAAALVLSEAEDCARSNGSGRSNSARLAPGHKFSLVDHPVEATNSSYLITGLSHSGAQPSPEAATTAEQGYSNEFSLQPSTLPFRPQRRTPRPVVEGSQTATVSGPEGGEIFSDEFGRIKVRFHWDRSSSGSDQCSCWVRVSQTWAGKGWGSVFIPRIGHEVIVDFLEGDPDQPIVTGSVYNGLNMPPYPLPNKQTVSTIKSESSTGGDGFNEIRFEDEKGAEEVFHHAQKNLKVVTKNNKNESVGANLTEKVGNDKSESVGNDESLTVKKNRTRSVGKDETVSVGGKRSKSIAKDETQSIGENRSLSVGKNETMSAGSDRSVSIGKKDSLTVGDDATITLGKKLTETIADDYSLQVGKDLKATIGKNWLVESGSGIIFISEKMISFKVGKASLILSKSGKITLKGSDITLKGSGKITIKGSKVILN